MFNTRENAVAGLLAFTMLAVPGHAQQSGYKGANHVIEVLTEKAGKKPAGVTDPEKEFEKSVELYVSKRAAIGPAAAAKGWLRLVDDYFELKPKPGQRRQAVGFSRLVSELPEPSAWASLSEAIDARGLPKGISYGREIGLRLLSRTLTGEEEKRQEVVGQLDAFFKTNDVTALGMLARSAKNLFDTFNRFGGEKAQLEEFEKQLERAEGNASDYGYVDLPDLVSLVGEEMAEGYLKRLFKTGSNIQVYDAKSTTALARRVALASVEDLKKPVWSLVNSVDALELYEALNRKFPSKSSEKKTGLEALENGFDGGDYERNQARFYYLMGLILANRTDEATKLVKEIGAQDKVQQFARWNMSEIVKSVGARPLYDYFHALLSDDADYPYWDATIYLASQVGESGKMVSLAERAVKREGLRRERRREISGHLASAYLADDRIEEAVGVFRGLLKDERADGAEAEDPMAAMMRMNFAAGGVGMDGTSPVAIAMRLAETGRLMERGDWVEEGVDKLLAEFGKPANPTNEYQRSAQIEPAVRLLLKLDRGPDAEKLALGALAAGKKKTQANNPYGMGMGGSSEGNQVLGLLARVYSRAGLHADVVRLMDAAPNWGVRDAKEFLKARNEHDKESIPMAYIAAKALAETGDLKSARAIAREHLYIDAGCDPVYGLLANLDGEKLLPFLDELYARDRFEERPLIWKAHILRKAGKLDEAEALVKAAIAVDPSDGEQGKGDRMRVYSVYADIFHERKDAKQEEFFRGVVRAIRMSEDADDFYAVGMYGRGIKMYRASLSHFSDAYCIQSRLAIQLSELGQHEDAEKYYLKAYELMPDSFGRVESHCFGCERAFNGKRAQGVAERVFTRLVKERPEKPQIHYLLGYLRLSQNRYPEALAYMRKATDLDPDYLNAWKKIVEMSRNVQLSREIGELAALNLIRLDPLGKHGRTELGYVRNMEALWHAAKGAVEHFHKPMETLYPLTASAAALEDKMKANVNQSRHFFPPMDQGGNESGPGDFIARHNVVQSISHFIDSTRGTGGW